MMSKETPLECVGKTVNHMKLSRILIDVTGTKIHAGHHTMGWPGFLCG